MDVNTTGFGGCDSVISIQELNEALREALNNRKAADLDKVKGEMVKNGSTWVSIWL